MKYISKPWQKIICLGIVLSCQHFIFADGYSKKQSLITIINDVVAGHPLVEAAKENLLKAKADANASSQPLYNPELSLDYESNVANTSTVGLSQTIDWSDKRATFTQISEQNKLIALTKYTLARQQVVADFLRKINRFQTSKKASNLNFQQSSTLEQFVDIAEKRFMVGDINQIELDLALLVAGEIRMNSSRIQAKHFAAKTELFAFVNFENIDIPEITTQMIELDQQPVERLLENHPQLKQLRLATQIARVQIKLASKQKHADPTISVNAGKEGDENIYSLGISLPLFVRNDFSAEVESAIANATAIEQQYRNSYRNILVAVKSSRQTLSLTLKAYHDWVRQSQKGLQQRSQLLQKLWRSGDLSTTDYLVQIQQTLETQIAAVQLKAELIDAWITYLITSGKIESWLSDDR